MFIFHFWNWKQWKPRPKRDITADITGKCLPLKINQLRA